MAASTWLLLGLVAVGMAVALARDVQLPGKAVSESVRLVRSVWLELLLGFVLAGLVQVLLPAAMVKQWLGSERLGRGLLAGWAAGLVLPGGPYFFFPLAAGLSRGGAAAGPLIALITAKTLVSPVRMFAYEAPLLGWRLTLARCLPAFLLPPLLGLLGQWLFVALRR